LRFSLAYALPLILLTGTLSANSPTSLSDDQSSSLETSITKVLIDPESARFTDITATQTKNGLVSACGFVNAKNRYGGYAGSIGFFGSFRESGFELRALATDADEQVRVRDYCRMFGIWE